MLIAYYCKNSLRSPKESSLGAYSLFPNNQIIYTDQPISISEPDSINKTTAIGLIFSNHLKDMFLQSPMTQPEYMKVPMKYFPEDIINFYKLKEIEHDDNYIYIKIIRGMYGLKQAALLAHCSYRLQILLFVHRLFQHNVHCRYVGMIWT